MITVPSADSDRKVIYDAVKEMSDSMLRQDSERSLQKDICDRVKDEVGLEPKYLKKLAKVYHNQNFVQVQTEQDDFIDLYEAIVK